MHRDIRKLRETKKVNIECCQSINNNRKTKILFKRKKNLIKIKWQKQMEDLEKGDQDLES